MKNSFANVLRRLLNAAGMLCLVYGGISAGHAYSALHAIASTGSAPTGIRLSGLPATIDVQLFTMFLGFLLFELAELIWRHHMRSNNSFKPNLLRGG